jgi:hypothetical protein
MDMFLPESDPVFKKKYTGYLKTVSEKNNQELLDAYNREARIGIVGVRAQATFIKAIHQAFIERFGISPVYGMHKNLIQLSGKLNSLYELIAKPVVVRFTLKNNQDVFLRLSTKIKVESSNVYLLQHLTKVREGFVFYRENISNTTFHAEGFSNYFMMKFNENNKYETIDFLDSGSKVYSINTQARTVIVLPWPTDIKLEEISEVSILVNS